MKHFQAQVKVFFVVTADQRLINQWIRPGLQYKPLTLWRFNLFSSSSMSKPVRWLVFLMCVSLPVPQDAICTLNTLQTNASALEQVRRGRSHPQQQLQAMRGFLERAGLTVSQRPFSDHTASLSDVLSNSVCLCVVYQRWRN